jgi:hypothetical protein
VTIARLFVGDRYANQGAIRSMSQRRFPPPWTVEDLGSCFVVKDSAGQKKFLGPLRKKSLADEILL